MIFSLLLNFTVIFSCATNHKVKNKETILPVELTQEEIDVPYLTLNYTYELKKNSTTEIRQALGKLNNKAIKALQPLKFTEEVIVKKNLKEAQSSVPLIRAPAALIKQVPRLQPSQWKQRVDWLQKICLLWLACLTVLLYYFKNTVRSTQSIPECKKFEQI